MSSQQQVPIILLKEGTTETKDKQAKKQHCCSKDSCRGSSDKRSHVPIDGRANGMHTYICTMKNNEE
jgi:hypothetical protein